jgi:hypothetical protein
VLDLHIDRLGPRSDISKLMILLVLWQVVDLAHLGDVPRSSSVPTSSRGHQDASEASLGNTCSGSITGRPETLLVASSVYADLHLVPRPYNEQAEATGFEKRDYGVFNGFNVRVAQ